MRGYAAESWAQTSAPKSVRIPATIQTERTPGTEGTWRLISEGCTKMEAPMMMPTTMAVAWSNPMGRSGAVAKMGPSLACPGTVGRLSNDRADLNFR